MDEKRREELARETLPLARHIAYRAARKSGREYDDLLGECCVAMIESMDRWDESKGVPFRLYAGRRMNGACLDWMRRTDHMTRWERSTGAEDQPLRRPLSLEMLRGEGYDHEDTSDDPTESMSHYCQDFWQWLDRTEPRWLNLRMRRIIKRYFEDGLTMEAIAQEEGVSGSYVTILLRDVWRAAAMYGQTLRDAWDYDTDERLLA